MVENKIHAFEVAGLGKAPFRYIGQEVQDIAYGQAVVSGRDTGLLITTKPGGTCAYCGTYIVNMFNVKSADGKVFHVGSDCIAKVGDAGLRKAVEKAVKANNAARRHSREALALADGAAFLALAEVQAKLASLPHPQAFRAAKGETLANCVSWFMANAGTSGKLRAIKMARKACE